MELGQIETAKIPIAEVKTTSVISNSSKVYPTYEDLTLRKINVMSEEQAIEGLVCLEALVTAIGLPTIIKVVRAIEKNPTLLQQAMTYLPLILK